MPHIFNRAIAVALVDREQKARERGEGGGVNISIRKYGSSLGLLFIASLWSSDMYAVVGRLSSILFVTLGLTARFDSDFDAGRGRYFTTEIENLSSLRV